MNFAEVQEIFNQPSKTSYTDLKLFVYTLIMEFWC